MEKSKNPTAVKLAAKAYFGEIWKLRKHSIASLVLPGIANTFVLYVPSLIVALLISEYSGQAPSLEQVLPYIYMLAAAWFFGELMWRISDYFTNLTVPAAMYNLYNDGIEKLLQKDVGFFHNNFAGALTKKLISYGKSFDLFFSVLTFNVSASLLPVIFASVVLWQFSPWIVLFLFVVVSFTMILIVPLVKRRQKLVDIRESSNNIMAGYMADIIGNADAVLAFANLDYELKNNEQHVREYTKNARKSWDYGNMRVDLTISPFYVLINVVGLAIAVAIGSNQLDIAAIFVTFTYYSYITRFMWEFNSVYRNIESSITEAAQFTELFIEGPDIENVKNPITLAVNEGKIEFNNVGFKYKDGNETLFKNLNLSIKPGEKIALVGSSGSGKTTITKLLLRFKEINKGKILIDNQNIAKCTLDSLRKNIAYVPQEPIMFHRTIAENISYGKLNATEEEIITAALQANAHDFIETLPQGYETYVGERGVKLSGGQRQRIAIARAMIKDAQILVLDEATSALDSESEKAIQEALWELMEGRTAIVIAHRLSTIQRMDRIVVINDGKIIEQGSHKELIAKNGVYAKLWKHQSGGFITD